MYVTARSYLTAGIAALGVGAIALAPVQPIPSTVTIAPQRVVENLAVELAASSIDPITPWVTTFETAGANIATLVEFYLEKPFPILQTIGANIATYIEELGNGQGGLIPEQIWNNIVTFFEAPWSPGATFEFPVGPEPQNEVTLPVTPPDYITETEVRGNDASSLYLLFLQLSAGQSQSDECKVDGDCLAAQLGPVMNFLASPYSGQLVGLLGPVLAPVVVLTRSFTAIGEFFEAGDVTGAINELINIPANLTNGVLNGAGFLDLTGVIAALGFLPPDFEDAKIGFNLGGLLNAMPKNGSLIDPDNPPTEYSVGIGLDSAAIITEAVFPGIPNGWFGSTIGLGQFLGEQLLVTAPAPPPVAAEPEAATVAAPEAAAPALAEAPAEDAAPAVVDVPAAVEESAPAADEVEDSAPAAPDADVAEVAEVAEETAPAVVDVPEVEAAPADVADDPAPEPAASVGSDDAGDTGSRASDSRRGAGSAD